MAGGMVKNEHDDLNAKEKPSYLTCFGCWGRGIGEEFHSPATILKTPCMSMCSIFNTAVNKQFHCHGRMGKLVNPPSAVPIRKKY